jgi:hypothetical protein
MDTTDPMVDLFLSGRAHIYYALIGAGSLIGLVALGTIGPIWLFLSLAILTGIFVDLWCHWYAR